MRQSLPVRRESSRHALLLCIWVGLNVIDAIVTYVALGSGAGAEGNPLLLLAMGHLQLVPVLTAKVILAIPVAILFLRWQPKLLWTMSILMACVVTWGIGITLLGAGV